MNTVSELLKDKIQEVAYVEPDETAHDAMQIMADKKIGALLVEENGKMVGIISERTGSSCKRNYEQPCGTCKP
jgi:CBS domain-containing protein